MPFGYFGDYAVLWLILVSLFVHTWCFFRFFPRKRLKRSGLIFGNVLIFACLLGVVAMAAESYLRFLSVRTDSFGVSLPARRWFALNTQLNSAGCRDHEWKREKANGVRRIAFIGDSFTYGWGIARVEDRFSDLIRARFDQTVPNRVEIMNVARPGWGTSDEVRALNDIIDAYAVDEIVLCYVFNDIEKLLPIRPDFDPTRPPEPRLFNPDSSCLMDWLFRAIVLPRAASIRGYADWLADGYLDAAIWRNHQQELLAVAQSCAQRGVTFRVALLPFIRIHGAKFNQEQLHTRLRVFLETSQISVVDLLPSLSQSNRKQLVVNAQDAHPNETAHLLFADAIWNAFFAK